jgi:hypothetical protein
VLKWVAARRFGFGELVAAGLYVHNTHRCMKMSTLFGRPIVKKCVADRKRKEVEVISGDLP